MVSTISTSLFSSRTPKSRRLAILGLAGAIAAHAALGTRPAQAGAAAQPISPVGSEFLWGVATAGHQYEGGDTHSNWAKWILEGHTPDRNEEGAQGYARYNEDLDLAKSMGLNAWRMSLEWSRIEPREGHIDEAEVAHYHQELAAVRAHGMTPVVTLMHFAYPAWLEAEGGWESPQAAAAYNRYVAFVMREFGAEIRWYLTFNEPNMFLQGGYQNGFFPPGKKLAFSSSWTVVNHLMEAHRVAYETIHAARPDAKVSFNLYATRLRLFGFFGGETSGPGEHWFIDQAMKGDATGKHHLDFACLDYYCRTTLVGPRPHDAWEVYPQGFYDVLKDYHAWTGLPVLVAENGLATHDGKPRADGWTRGTYLTAHVKQLQRAQADGIPVLGYIHWSITDNYEWGSYAPRFGLYRVEAKNHDYRRIPTDGVEAFKAITAASGVTPDIEARFKVPTGVSKLARVREPQ